MASKPIGGPRSRRRGGSADAAIAVPRPPASDTETALLDAALAEVLEHGIRRTTASDIARRARVSRQTLYRYWPDAQAVFAALVTRELLAALPAAPADPQELGELVEVVVETADRIRRMPLLDRLRDTDPELLGRYVLERLGTSQRAIHADLARRIAAGQRPARCRHRTRTPPPRWCCSSRSRRCSPRRSWRSGSPTSAWRAELRRALAGYLGGAP